MTLMAIGSLWAVPANPAGYTRTGKRTRLGTTTSMRRATFRISDSEASAGNRVRLLAETIGRRTA